MNDDQGAVGQKGAVSGQTAPRGSGAVSYVENAPTAAPPPHVVGQSPHDPLATPGVRRILLSERASEALTESGEECFAIVARQSWPHDPKRWAIYLLPVALRVANDATAVLLGKARAVRSRKPSLKP
jgi:hypothetical protein